MDGHRRLEPSTRARQRALVATFFATTVALVATTVHVALQSLPHNPLRDAAEEHPGTLWWLPQGWAFFTKPAQEPMRTLYLRSDDGWQAVSWRRSQLRLGWGLSRRPTIQMLELTRALEPVWDAVAEDCEIDPFECIAEYDDVLEIENLADEPTICGEIAIVEQAPVPWAWREFERVNMPSQVAVVRLSC